MLSWSYKVGFLGTILLWEICLNRTGAGVNATPVLNRQGGNVLVAAFSAVAFLLPKWIYILRRSLWSRVRALPPLSILQLQLQTCHKRVRASRPLGIEQDCSFRMSREKWKYIDKVLRTNRFFQDKTTSSKAPLRQLSKI